jgi:hypothetical protein
VSKATGTTYSRSSLLAPFSRTGKTRHEVSRRGRTSRSARGSTHCRQQAPPLERRMAWQEPVATWKKTLERAGRADV